MRKGISIVVTASDRARLEGIVAARGSPQKHVWRARIVLLSDDGVGTVAIMAATGKSKTCVWRWQERFMAEGVDGLLRDKTRPPGIARLKPTLVDKVVALTLEPPDHEATHWTVRAMAKAVGIAASSVVKIWHDHGLAPHRWRSFKLSNDKAFAEKLHDVVGLYVSPPAHAIVLSVDEKSQIQALDRTQPGLPLKRGRGATMTHLLWTPLRLQAVFGSYDTESDAAICPACNAAMKLLARMGVRGPEPFHNRVFLDTMGLSGSSGPVSPTVVPYPPSTDCALRRLWPASAYAVTTTGAL